MQIVINSTDTIETLIVARNTINDILARRAHREEPSTAAAVNTSVNAPKPLGPALSDATEMSNQPAPEPAPAPKKAKPKVVKTVSAEEVRMVMVAKSAEGKRDDVIAVLHGFGAKKLSEVAPEQLPDLKAKLEAL